MKLRQCSVFASLALAALPSTTATSAMTAVEIFDDDACSGAPLQVVFSASADCSRLTSDSNCSLEATDLGLFASGNCTDDPVAFTDAAFGDSPYVLVELYAPESNCETLEGVAAYRVDSECHPTVDAGTSFQANWDDDAPTFKLFADQACSSTPVFQFELAVDSRECYGGSMRLHVNANSASATGD
ncbi:hypothetical protein PF005_g22418 [Phytophthora fragariae]|uniref:Uncharacterized protein n=1 Tax=Phytophthora fragariae TaxID=53985 RepID=A0A6A3RY93_9STRA|nr:hypothetical protein PF009_g23527 [Phytophthora fragariae]KAE8983000.1 hypothetical protein PF011_g21378 [Phytophthora fragariae]KAE9082208.1 hypothetical protein PF010_g21681 [Phytophthora fragariae]KAE9082821.1 hypothetical protein PF007_g22156 [Phytophthora fragariae]KAE9105945.1 hypothetical protein PF006_g21486 [Phytophthora fragariae]